MPDYNTLVNRKIDGSLEDLKSLEQVFGLLNHVFEHAVQGWPRQYEKEHGLAFSSKEVATLKLIIEKSLENGTGVSLEMDHGSLWIESDPSAEIDVVTSALQFWLAHTRSDEAIQIEWSNIMDKRYKVEAFGGGAAHITREGIHVMTTRSFLQRKTLEMQ